MKYRLLVEGYLKPYFAKTYLRKAGREDCDRFFPRMASWYGLPDYR